MHANAAHSVCMVALQHTSSAHNSMAAEPKVTPFVLVLHCYTVSMCIVADSGFLLCCRRSCLTAAPSGC